MVAINTNTGALNARMYALSADREQSTAMERLSSGLRVNQAADDAAGLAVANKMTNQLRGINMGIRNAQDGVGLIQSAEAGTPRPSAMTSPWFQSTQAEFPSCRQRSSIETPQAVLASNSPRHALIHVFILSPG